MPRPLDSSLRLDELVAERHVGDPQDIRYNGRMLYSVYSDGEVTLQKAGDLWGRRLEHVIDLGERFTSGRGGDGDSSAFRLPCTTPSGEHTYCVVDAHEVAELIRAFLLRSRSEG